MGQTLRSVQRAEEETVQICVFRIGRHTCGLPLDDVLEVALGLDIRAIPLAPDKVAGISFLRGTIIQVINGKFCMELHDYALNGNEAYIVLKSQEELFAIAVDKIDDILQIPKRNFARPPSTLPPSQHELVEGAYLYEQSLIVLLSPTSLCKIPKTTLSYTAPPGRLD